MCIYDMRGYKANLYEEHTNWKKSVKSNGAERTLKKTKKLDMFNIFV